MKEIVVISGKGGTGKTSMVASFAALAPGNVLADCDVDAADLHLILAPEVKRREPFSGGHEAVIHSESCTRCGLCAAKCRYEAIVKRDGPAGEEYAVDPFACEGCGVCVRACPVAAIELRPRTSGEWFVSETRYGPMVHACLRPAAENSGKLVTQVRRQASQLAKERGADFVIVDGPPGIACPVIASVSGASLVLIVTEPTASGLHDMKRAAGLAAHFEIPAMICINKCDLNREVSEAIRNEAAAARLWVAGEVPYDPTAFVRAQIAGLAPVELDRHSTVSREIERTWRTVSGFLCR